jgi:hypothetical protein
MSNAPRARLIGVAALMAFAWATPAQAHIIMVGDIVSRGGDEKLSPCDGAKGKGPVYTFEPGATIKLQLMEPVAHPSYFRISFDNDGDDGFVEPASIKPIDPTRACPFDADDHCGESDYCNVVSSAGAATVLWDDLNPHLAADAKAMSWNIKLPDIECENCTIQVIQVMEDNEFHGAYCPQGSCPNAKNSLEDIYHRCIDIKLQRGATNSAGTTTEAVNNQGTNCLTDAAGGKGSAAAAGGGGPAGAAGTGAKPTSDADSDSGCSVLGPGSSTHASWAWAAVLGAVCMVMLRRRRSR